MAAGSNEVSGAAQASEGPTVGWEESWGWAGASVWSFWGLFPGVCDKASCSVGMLPRKSRREDSGRDAGAGSAEKSRVSCFLSWEDVIAGFRQRKKNEHSMTKRAETASV